MIRLTAVLLLASLNARGEIIFLDLNDAPQEIAACRKGVQDGSDAKGGTPEALHVVNPDQYKKRRGDNSRYSNAYNALKARIEDLLNRGVTIDSIVISGEDGSGEFFGSNGTLQYYELKRLTEEFPALGRSLKTAAVWGCYPATVHGAEQFWLNRLPNMQFTMGFVGQGPDKTRPANHFLLQQFCQRREEAAEATNMNQLCRFYYSLQHLTKTSVGVCNREGLASAEYAIAGKQEPCFTYKDLYERCGDFINSREMQRTYDLYISGDVEPPEDTTEKPSDLRKYYNEVNKWRHCVQKYKHERGTDMPFPPQLIRLIKYQKVKKNLAERNGTQLRDYDAALERQGLGALKLGDITQLSRKELNDKIRGAIAALEGKRVAVPSSSRTSALPAPSPQGECDSTSFMFSNCARGQAPAPQSSPSKPETLSAVKDATLLRMAQCARRTFVMLDHTCVPFDSVGDNARTRSLCLMGYEEAQRVSEDDPC